MRIGLIGAGNIGSAVARLAVDNGHEVVLSNSRGPATLVDLVDELAGKVVIDTNNYYPPRDGHLARLDDGSTTSSELLAVHLPTSKVVKAFNSIRAAELAKDGQPAGTPNPRALPIAGDDPGAKAIVASRLDEFGYDVVDAGPLAEGQRFQPGAGPYLGRLDAASLRAALNLA